MAGEPQISIVGNLVDDPELRFTSGGAAVASFRVASTPRFFDRQANEWRDGDATFLTCQVWRNYAENVAESLTKGARVIVVGRLKQRSYETNNGERRTVYEVDVDDVGPALRNATASITKVNRSGAGGGAGAPSGGNSSAGGASGRSVNNDDPWATPPGPASDEPPF